MISTLLAAVVLKSSSAAAKVAPQLPPLHVQGAQLLDSNNKPVILKGCNTGNWLLIEFWMLGLDGKKGSPNDQWELEQLLSKRFGHEEDERLMDVYRSSWMTERDWDNIKSFGFNLVRVPINYRLLEDDEKPMHLRADAFQWLDKAVDEAEKHGLYVILDLHGAQGGQTMNDHTGHSGQNKLWTVPENQERMAWLWTQIAKRYKDRSAVLAYDTLNEPYGGTKPQILKQFEKTYPAIRSVDPEKLIFAHGQTDNFDFYGDPKEHGWHNVGFQMHYYPGLFGDAPKVKSNVRHLASLENVAKKVEKVNVPFLVGEMNVVMKSTGGAPMMRRYFDAHASHGWLTTMWSYKVITAEGGTGGGSWGMYTNSGPAKAINFDTASKSDIETYFRSFATQPLEAYDDLVKYLVPKEVVLPPLPQDAAPRTTAPGDEVLDGWKSTDIGGAMKGGLVKNGASFDLYGEGEDIWGSSDQFRFLSRPFSGDFTVSVTIDAMEDTSTYTKAGLMVRASLDGDSAAALLSSFSGGDVQAAIRSTKAGNMEGSDGPKTKLPTTVQVSRVGGTIVFSANGKEFLRKSVPALSGLVYVGPVALSHSGGELTKVTYRDLKATGK